MVLAAQSTTGDANAVIKNRIKFWEEWNFISQIFGTNKIPWDYVIIAPQIKQNTTITYDKDGQNVSKEIKGEHLQVQNDWKIITKEEVVLEYSKGNKFLESWCFAEAKKFVPKLAIGA